MIKSKAEQDFETMVAAGFKAGDAYDAMIASHPLVTECCVQVDHEGIYVDVEYRILGTLYTCTEAYALTQAAK